MSAVEVTGMLRCTNDSSDKFSSKLAFRDVDGRHGGNQEQTDSRKRKSTSADACKNFLKFPKSCINKGTGEKDLCR